MNNSLLSVKKGKLRFLKINKKITIIIIFIGLFSFNLFAQKITASKMISFHTGSAANFKKQTKNLGFNTVKEITEPVIGASLKYRIEMNRIIEDGDESISYRTNTDNSVKINYTTTSFNGNVVLQQFKKLGFKYITDYIDTEFTDGWHYYTYANGNFKLTTAQVSGYRFFYLELLK
jgi:hypothetical protein